MNEQAVQIEGLNIAIRNKTLYQNLSMVVPESTITALMGPGGSGKSTLLHLIAGLLDDTPIEQSGRLQTRGRNGRPEAKVAVIQQQPRQLMRPAIDWLRQCHPGRSSMEPAGLRSDIEKFVDELGMPSLSSRLDEKPIDWTLIERRLLLLAGCLIEDPDILCLDEPCVGLEENEARRFLDVLDSQRRRRATLWCTHHQRRARSVADRVVLLAGGRIVESAPCDEFFDEPKSQAAQTFVKTGSCAVPAPDTRPEELAPEFREPGSTDGDSDPESSAESGAEAVTKSRRRDRHGIEGGWRKNSDIQVREPMIFRRRSHESAHRGPTGFRWVWPGLLGGTPKPGVFRPLKLDLQALLRTGVGALVTLTEDPLDVDDPGAFDIAYRHHPIVDMEAPTIEEAVNTCRWVDDQLTQGRAVAYHCRAGIGRTGTMIACQVMVTTGEGANDVMKRIRSIHNRYVQSKAQEEFLQRFFDAVVV